jgi:biopolymer transport protein ExbD
MAVKLGSGATGNKAPAENADINVTPFVDIMLVLLIIFMVAAPPPTVNVNVDLPPANTNPPPPDPNNKPLFISLNADGSVLVSLGIGGDAVGTTVQTIAEVPNEVLSLMPAATDRATKATYIRADFDVPYKSVMELMNKLRGAGVKKIGLVGEATG